ncbi:MAG: metal-dependent transcriptional regulator [Chitinophagaceae bacterium]|nr:metal-dependent transcriptional regulator [Chitinophagaceae bacterium]
MNYSISEENYLKAIYLLQSDGNLVTTNALALELETSASSVTDMLKKLKQKKLLHYQPYRGFKLSMDGRKVALDIVRRHRLWEYFLSEKLKFKWDEVHELAEELEHVNNKKLTDRLDEYLGHPKFDPHGDPIPDSFGKMVKTPLIKLSQLTENKTAEVYNVGNQSTEILHLLKHHKIQIGTRLEVKRIFPFDHSMEIKVKSLSPITISEQLAENIYVKIL